MKTNRLKTKALLLGNNQQTGWIAEKLLEGGTELIVATPQEAFDFSSESEASLKTHASSVALFPATSVESCKGSIGNFNLRMLRNGESFFSQTDEIIICEDFHRQPEFSLYGLSPSPSIVPLTRVLNKSQKDNGTGDLPVNTNIVVFLLGLHKESHPAITREVMETALHLQQAQKRVYILTGNLKVAAQGLERLYRETRKSGVVYVKFTDTRPDIKLDTQKHAIIEFKDEILDRHLRLSPDLTVVDETPVPSDYLERLIRIFALDAGPDGFAQADNVHRLNVLTNRKGILVAGPSRSILSPEDQWVDAADTVLGAKLIKSALAKDNPSPAEIDPGNCVRCLTCFRLCPYHAITVNARAQVQVQACESCGICLAECPRGAIQMRGPDSLDISKAVESIEAASQQSRFVPTIAAFCCSRSAVQAGKLASNMGCTMPEGLRVIEVPCAGSLSIRHLLAGFQSNVDGVLVLTCHAGNCHSEKGNLLAIDRINHLKTVVERMGFESGRLMLRRLASNMGREFSEIANTFEKRLVEFGPSRLKQ
jgi:coenzyme F420-reducing hydrogenase delta subunit/NAD-dependent dihydropyrimidine dehydrogenase PreA subunit